MEEIEEESGSERGLKLDNFQGSIYEQRFLTTWQNQKKSRCSDRHTSNEKLQESVEKDWRVDVRSTSKFILIPSNIHNIIMLRGRR